jgi:type III restriction enzyme
LKAYAKLRVADAGQIAFDYGSITPNASVAMVTLAKTCFKLARDIETHVGDLKDQAIKIQFKQLVPDGLWAMKADWNCPLVFEANRYPVRARSRYARRYDFSKHFYPVLADLKDSGEEFLCAQLMTTTPR